ncbi:ferredoxin [Candidatus Parcubacteria bacterium]|nr:MAG: ferredoxin [Candidatus Parcubacteria bacterium]
MKKYKVIIDKKKCFGCGTCQLASEKYFKLSDQDGLITIDNFEEKNGQLNGEINENELADFEKAAQSCPEGVIKIQK